MGKYLRNEKNNIDSADHDDQSVVLC